MDAVITYVNGADPLWQEDYARASNTPMLQKRFRDWGTLPYLLRGIERNMPFIEQTFLVVSRESQIPKWASKQLKIVLHREIIPGQFLPTFNSTTIELFLHRIPGLSEEFIYFNDDIFPLKECAPEYFFSDGKIRKKFSRHLFALNMYKRQSRNSDRLARKASGLAPSPFFLRPQHSCSPMFRSACESLYEAVENELAPRISPLRSPENVNQYVFQDYLFHTGRVVNRRISCQHISVAGTTPASLASTIRTTDKKFICVNDVSLPDSLYPSYRDTLHTCLEELLPEKSRFEL